MLYEIHTTDVFEKWASSIRDLEAARAIALRLARVRAGNLGDVAPIGEGISEMRIFVGKGYRLYFTIRGGDLITLLCGGDKSSQQRDIKKAIELANNL